MRVCTVFVRKSYLKTIHSTVSSFVTVCPCEQFVLENCHGSSDSLNMKDWRNPGSTPGLFTHGKWLNHSATEASKWYQILRHFSGASGELCNTTGQTLKRFRKTNKTRDTKCLGRATENAGSDVVIFIFLF